MRYRCGVGVLVGSIFGVIQLLQSVYCRPSGPRAQANRQMSETLSIAQACHINSKKYGLDKWQALLQCLERVVHRYYYKHIRLCATV